MADLNEKLFSTFPPVSTEEWEAKILEDLKGADYDKKLIWRTPEGFNVRPYYRSGDIKAIPYHKFLPDEAPYVRGNRQNDNSWEIRQDMDTIDPVKANIAARDAIERGATAIGFGIGTVTDEKSLSAMLREIDFSRIAVHFGGAVSYTDFAELLAKVLSEEAATQIRGSFDFDPLSNLLLEGDFRKSEAEDLGELSSMIKFGAGHFPFMRMINVNGQYLRNAGSNIVQELAFSLAAGNEYLALASNSGIVVDDAASRIMFTLATGSDYFMEIAKLRAARLLWSRIVEQYNPLVEESRKMYIHCISLGYNKTLYDPYVNMLRTTTETMSAIIGGAQSITVLPFDAFYKEPDEFSNRIARNQQIILKEEAYLDKVVDPAAGSYYLENLTDSIAKAAWDLFRLVEEKGGMLAAVKEGFVQDTVHAQAEKFAADVATRKLILLGTNQYPNLEEEMLDKIQEADEATDVESEEVPSRFKKLELSRLADAFEDLRLATESYVAQGAKRPAVFLFTIGNLAMRKARAMFATNFFGCAGYQVIDNSGFSDISEGIDEALKSKAEIVVICSSDEEYAQIAAPIAEGLKKRNNEIIVVVAGYPKEILESLKAAGVDEFIHIRSNLLETLESYHEALGIN